MIPFTVMKEKIRQVLHLGDSPQRTALAFAVGVLIAFSPTYGLHFASAFLCAWAFRLNFLALMAGTLVNNPWTVLPIVGSSLWMGLLLDPVNSTPPVDWTSFSSLMLWDQFQLLWTQFRPYLVPFILGHVLLGIIGATIGYVLLYHAILRLRAHQAQAKHLVTPPPSC